ncbi:serine threonine- kinase sgk2 [Trichoderma arundinaceum]|uniref:Serine threonine-kinase sgk2 n=1 Tax=Trichoderma arundinaceum TaxID=490622 RepID=A0A395NTC8_TRIAR|nr:serine threonine- kinase sgk2 [Trichoderma arundinaceum]
MPSFSSRGCQDSKQSLALFHPRSFYYVLNPVNHSSASPQESEQTRRKIEPRQPTRPFVYSSVTLSVGLSMASDAFMKRKSVAELLEALCDAYEVHRPLFLEEQILHRNISGNNSIIINPRTADSWQLQWVLIDVDLAKEDVMGH